MTDNLLLPTPSGYPVPVTWYEASDAKTTVVLMAALGVRARFYQPLATALCEQAGVNVALVEQRGHGDSSLRPSRRVDFGFREALLEDIPAVLDEVERRAPGSKRLLMGHSLGGHYAAITAGRLPERIDGVVIVACGTPWIEAFAGRIRQQLRLLCLLIPPVLLLLGYYPGERLGFGGREARTLMRDWLVMARTNAYRAHGVDEDFDAAIARYCGPLLAIRLEDDRFAPAAAMDAVSGKFRSAVVTKVLVNSAELGDAADHFRWARTPGAIVRHVRDWLDGLPAGG